MKESLNILFLGGAKRVSLAQRLIDAGKLRNMEIAIFSYELTAIVPIASLGKVIIGKRYSDKAVYEDLKRVVIEHDINIILPFIDPFIEVCCVLKGLLPDVFIPVSDIEIVRTMYDKLNSDRWFREKGFMVPQRYSQVTEEDLPVIAKPVQGSASKGIEIISEIKQWQWFCDHKQGEYLIQSYVADNNEYTVDCYVSQKREIVSVVPRIRMETFGGEVTVSKTILDEEIRQCSCNILKAGAFFGPVTIQFIRDKQRGQLYVMEINPRYGGGVIASIAAGANTLEVLLDEARHISVKEITHWQPETVMTRYLKEVIFYADNY